MHAASFAHVSLFVFFSFAFSGFAFAADSVSILFLHHSTGGAVYSEGSVSDWFDAYNTAHGTQYNISQRGYPNSPYAWKNYPYDYWYLWVDGHCDSSQSGIECLDSLAADHDMIILKHCYPGADIRADSGTPDVASETKTLGNYKLQYRALRQLMDSYPDTMFMFWTLAPRHRLATNDENAARAAEFVDWVKNEFLTEDGEPHPNIFIFDFFGVVAESDTDPAQGKVNCLKYDYEKSHTGSNSHPNTLANETAGPIFSQAIVDAINNFEARKMGIILPIISLFLLQ